MSFLGARALITGGLGFIGSNLARRLVAEGAHVTVIDNLEPAYGGHKFNVEGISRRLNINIGDVRDSALMQRLIEGQDFLFNVAGQTGHVDSMSDPFTDLSINTTAQLSILEACRRVNTSVRIVFTSTRQLYGRPLYIPVDEKHPIKPVDVNGINKLAGEQYHILYNDVYGIRSCVLRLTNTFGPRMRVKDARQTFLGIWLRQLLEGKRISVFGDGSQRRDFNYIDDCVDAILLAATSDAAEANTFNIGGSEVLSLREIAELMVDVGGGVGYECLSFPPERKAIDIGDYATDFTRIREVLGWAPKVSMRAGLVRTIDFYRMNLPRYIGTTS